MLTSIVLKLQAAENAVLPAHLGRANYAGVLQRLGEVTPGVNDEIHAIEGSKPLTCSGLFGTAKAQREHVTLRTGEAAWLRVTGLTAPVSQALLAAFVHNPPTVWSLSGYRLQVTEVCCDPARHPWSGQATYEELAARYLLAPIPEHQLRRVSLELASPTTFKSKGKQMPLPLPGLVFGSLVDRWNSFSPVTLDPAMRTFGEELVAVSRFELRSVLVQQKNEAGRVGAMGQVAYIAEPHDRYWLSVFQMLADFALYSGVGVQTATGMGQVRRV